MSLLQNELKIRGGYTLARMRPWGWNRALLLTIVNNNLKLI